MLPLLPSSLNNRTRYQATAGDPWCASVAPPARGTWRVSPVVGAIAAKRTGCTRTWRPTKGGLRRRRASRSTKTKSAACSVSWGNFPILILFKLVSWVDDVFSSSLHLLRSSTLMIYVQNPRFFWDFPKTGIKVRKDNKCSVSLEGFPALQLWIFAFVLKS